MAHQLALQLTTLRNQINDLGINDEKAKEFENLLTKSIEVIQQMENPSDDFFERRKKAALQALENDLGKQLKGYWQIPNKVDKIALFSRTRNETSMVLSTVLNSFKH
jgi:hypothetical protein